MPPAAPRTLDGEWYRLALWLCPPVFRREHGDEMLRDFDDAREEAATRGRGALWTLRVFLAIDLVRTVGVQWRRTGIPAIALFSLAVQLVVAEVLSTIARRVSVPIPHDVAHPETVGVVLLVATMVTLIGMIITLNLWVSRLNARRRR